MSSSKLRKKFQWPTIAYALGLGVIVLGATLNLALPKLPPKQLYSLPDFIVQPYEAGGLLELTLSLCGVGLLLVLMGFAGSMVREKPAEVKEEPTPPGVPLATQSLLAKKTTPSEDAGDDSLPEAEPVDRPVSNGAMRLETSKYLRRKRGRREDLD